MSTEYATQILFRLFLALFVYYSNISLQVLDQVYFVISLSNSIITVYMYDVEINRYVTYIMH